MRLVAILQMDEMMKPALPEDLESMESGNYYNMELTGSVKENQGREALEQYETWNWCCSLSWLLVMLQHAFNQRTRRTGLLVHHFPHLLCSTKLPAACNTSKVGWMGPFVIPGRLCVRPLGTSLVYGKGC